MSDASHGRYVGAACALRACGDACLEPGCECECHEVPGGSTDPTKGQTQAQAYYDYIKSFFAARAGAVLPERARAAMSDLLEFLAARLDEDEAAAKAAWGVEWDWRYVAQPFGERPSIAHTVHIARHDPARVLREVEATRSVLAMWQEPETERYLPTGEEVAQVAVSDAIGGVIRQLAAVYSDHPDYDQEWRP